MRIVFFYLSLILSSFILISATSRDARAQDPKFERILAGRVHDIAEDPEGIIWIATRNGLFRYDGYQTQAYLHRAADSTSLSLNYVECLYVDRRGTLWVGTFGGGLSRFDPRTESFTHYQHLPEDRSTISNDTVTAIVEDRDGALWVGTVGGLNRYDRKSETFTRFSHVPSNTTSLSHDHVRVIYEDRSGTIWVGTGGPWVQSSMEGGLNRFNRKSGTFTRYMPDPDDATSLIDGRVTALNEDRHGNFWVGTWGDGLHRMDRGAGTFVRHRYNPDRPERLSRPHLRVDDPVFGGVTFIHEDQKGALWFGAFNGGLNRYDSKTGALTHLDDIGASDHGLAENSVWTIHESYDGTIWIATWGGLYKLIPEPVRLPRIELPGDNGPVYSMLEDRNGTVWIGTSSGGLYAYDPASEDFKNYRHDPNDPSSLGEGAVDALLEDGQGILWVGTHGGGLNRFNREAATFRRYKHDPKDPTSPSGNVVHDLFEDSKGQLWVGTTTGLNLFRNESGTFARFRHDPDDPASLSGDDIKDMCEDKFGRIWVATHQGLSLTGNSGRSFSEFSARRDSSTHLPNDQAMALRVYDEKVWIGSGYGLHRYDPSSDSLVQYTMANGNLSMGAATGILVDDMGHVWMVASSSPHVIRLNPDRSTVQLFEDEAPNRFARPQDDHLYKHRDGKLLIGGQWNAFYAFLPEEIEAQANPHPPKLALAFEVRGKQPDPLDTVRREGPIELAHNQNGFSFKYVAHHYASPEDNRYMYILEGHDDRWRGPGKQRTATYHNVPPGDYVFRIKAANSDGVWNEEGASVALTILPPWWRTRWAYALYCLLFIGIVAAAARAQRRYVLRKERETARERELEHAREIESMNERLRAHDKQLEAQNERLVELDGQKSRFFANISHEFRTPLTLLLGPLRDALHGGVEAGRLERHVPMMHRNAQRLLGLINQLLDLSNLEAGAMQLKPRRLELVDFVRELVLSFSARAEREGVALSFLPNTESIPAVFDPDKLEKVVANLLSNAFKFTPSGGKIRVGLSEEDDRIVITVKDTGRGIPADELPRILDRFYQVDGSTVREHEGTGIGLALTKELVELHDGSITADSEVGFGTTFTVQMPIKAEDGAPVEAYGRQEADSNVDGGGPAVEDRAALIVRGGAPKDAPSILVVDDNPDMRTYLRSLLMDQYRVLEAKDGEDGLKVAAQEHPDLVLADVMMPKKDGYSLCRELKSDPDLGHVPVVLLTAKADLESKLEGLETGADDYLAKPFSAEEVLARMENLIELRRRLRERYRGEVRLGPSDIDVPSEEAEFLANVRDVIESKMSESGFGVNELADAVGLSSRQLQRRLRESADLSAAAYIRMMRLERAAQLLEQEAGLISEIAFSVGFKNADHFSRLFRQVFGVPPSEYSRETSEGHTVKADPSTKD